MSRRPSPNSSGRDSGESCLQDGRMLTVLEEGGCAGVGVALGLAGFYHGGLEARMGAD